MNRIIGFIIILHLICYENTRAQDTLRIYSHKDVVVQTDPSKGVNSYTNWVRFPDISVDYRKINIHVTMQCPDSLMCGEWDYADHIRIMRTSKSKDKPLEYELGRIITPYGRFYQSDWFTHFSADITHFANLLRDSVEIAFFHSGYETREDRGWKINVFYEIVIGNPIAEILDFDTLYTGHLPFGNPKIDYSGMMTKMNFKTHKNAKYLGLYITQTGHGMDLTENCAEFCPKSRSITWNNKLIENKLIWKECASNILQPQAGTWIFDRAGWCPGELVEIDRYYFPLEKVQHNSISVKMEEYIDTSKNPSANFVTEAFLVQYGKPDAKHDITITDILYPQIHEVSSDLYPHNSAKVIVRNNGSQTLKNITFKFGFDSVFDRKITFDCNIPFGNSQTFSIPNIIPNNTEYKSFNIRAVLKKDKYPKDNFMNKPLPDLFQLPKEFKIAFKTNLDSTHTSWKILNSSGISVAESQIQLKANFEYSDNIFLEPGIYELCVTDTAGDGLEFWYFADKGMGHFRILSPDGKLIRNFSPDFGNGLRFFFYVDKKETFRINEETSLIYCYPFRIFHDYSDINLIFNTPTEVRYSFLKGDNVLMSEDLGLVSSKVHRIDLSAYEPGIYNIEVFYGERSKKNRIRISERKKK